jgi:hypothetical protein
LEYHTWSTRAPSEQFARKVRDCLLVWFGDCPHLRRAALPTVCSLCHLRIRLFCSRNSSLCISVRPFRWKPSIDSFLLHVSLPGDGSRRRTIVRRRAEALRGQSLPVPRVRLSFTLLPIDPAPSDFNLSPLWPSFGAEWPAPDRCCIFVARARSLNIWLHRFCALRCFAVFHRCSTAFCVKCKEFPYHSGFDW